MAVYKYVQNLQQSQHAAFDTVTEPGHPTPYSGVYRCDGCGREDVSTYSHPMPPQNHHQHTQSQGRIRWRLVVATAGR